MSQKSSILEVPAVKSLAMVRTRTVVGVQAVPVEVEVHLANGLPSFSTVGLAESAVRESKDRVRGALINSGFEFPAKRITVNLAPADLPKKGSSFDLPIAIGILLASGQLTGVKPDDYEFVGELALDGSLRQISGILPTAIASGEDKRTLIVPSENKQEASLATQSSCLHSQHLLKVCLHLVGQEEIEPCVYSNNDSDKPIYPDLSDVRSQHHAKRALEVAASGNHSLLFIGPPGSGKSMLAARLPGVLPDLSIKKAIECAAIQSVSSGKIDIKTWKSRPYRNPHHSASSVALVGGGQFPRPGEISLAHNGILFLDELTEFSRHTLEQLREPLESGVINIARANQSIQYPANFQLIAACNPCRCGYLGDGTNRCKCSAISIENYRNKLSGPMLDRIDMHVHLSRVSTQLLHANEKCDSSEDVKVRVNNTHKLQQKRQGVLNNELTIKQLEQYCDLDKVTHGFLDNASEQLNLSARAYHRIIRLARTIADMNQVSKIKQNHIAEAIAYRTLDRNC